MKNAINVMEKIEGLSLDDARAYQQAPHAGKWITDFFNGEITVLEETELLKKCAALYSWGIDRLDKNSGEVEAETARNDERREAGQATPFKTAARLSIEAQMRINGVELFEALKALLPLCSQIDQGATHDGLTAAKTIAAARAAVEAVKPVY